MNKLQDYKYDPSNPKTDEKGQAICSVFKIRKSNLDNILKDIATEWETITDEELNQDELYFKQRIETVETVKGLLEVFKMKYFKECTTWTTKKGYYVSYL